MTIEKDELENNVRSLIGLGASLDSQDENGSTALILAASAGYLSIVELLIKSGANLNLQNGKGDTALIEAVRGDADSISGSPSHIKIRNILYNSGADAYIENKKGETAIRIAEINEMFNDCAGL